MTPRLANRIIVLVGAVMLLQCEPKGAPAPASTAPSPAAAASQASTATPSAALSAAQPAAATATTGDGDVDAPMPGPNRQRLEAAVARNDGCVGCHQTEAEQWRGSHHQIANINPAYRHAFNQEPLPFCRGCHAPEADPQRAPSAAVSNLGVGCVSCHVTPAGAILAAASKDDDPSAVAHAVVRSKAFSQTGGCANCHEFRFPFKHGDEDGDFMQTTVREHARSGAASKACASCHMPLENGRRSHAFAQVRDPAWLRSRLRVAVERTPRNTIRIALQQTDPGHAFPSGDLFRRLEVRAELRAPDGTILSEHVRHLARHLDIVPGKPGRNLVLDNRLLDKPKDVEFAPPAAAVAKKPAAVTWRVTYQRVASAGSGHDPAQVHVESEVVLHTGRFNWGE